MFPILGANKVSGAHISLQSKKQWLAVYSKYITQPDSCYGRYPEYADREQIHQLVLGSIWFSQVHQACTMDPSYEPDQTQWIQGSAGGFVPAPRIRDLDHRRFRAVSNLYFVDWNN